jgi:nucleoside-diphosphate-sugar epimerase
MRSCWTQVAKIRRCLVENTAADSLRMGHLIAQFRIPQSDTMKKVLVTGATGFLGQPCLADLLSCADEVHVLSRKQSNLAQKGLYIHIVDLFDCQRLSGVFSRIRPSHLLHLAWLTTPRLYWTSPENIRWIEASLQLVRLFAEYGGTRMVLAGSCAEYDWRFGHCDETTTPVMPASLYGASKNGLRTIVESFAAQVGVSMAWARFFFLYGPHEHPSRLVPSVIHSLFRNKETMCTNGTQQRDFLHVQDAAEAVILLLHSSICGSINIASGQAVAVREVIQSIAKYMGKPNLVRLGALPTAAAEPPLLVADVKRLRNELNWSPRIGLDEGLAQAINWWRSRIL